MRRWTKQGLEGILDHIFEEETVEIEGSNVICWQSTKRYSAEDIPSVVGLILQNGRSIWRSNLRCFMTLARPAWQGEDVSGHLAIWVMPIPVLQVIAFSEVGSHEWDLWYSSPRHAWQKVQASLRPILAFAPFEITYADEAGLHVRFVVSVDAPMAYEIARLLNEIRPTPTAICGRDDDLGDALVKALVATQGFELFWE